jgi:hypothetical protein
MSIAAALYGFAPDNNWWALYFGYPLAMGIGFGMVVGDHHWASDVVAGAMLGHAVGYTVGRRFRKAYEGDKESPSPRAFSIEGIQAIPTASGMTVTVYGRL